MDPELHYGQISRIQKDGTPPFPRRNAHNETLYSTWTLLLAAQSPCLVGRKPATCRACGKIFPRPNAALSNSPAMSRRSSVVSWSDSPCDQAAPKSDDAVMEDCTECHQAEISRKIRANDKLRKILTNVPDEHKSLIYGDSLKAKLQSLDDEKVALLAAKR